MYRISSNSILPWRVFHLHTSQNQYIKRGNYLNSLKFCDIKKVCFLGNYLKKYGNYYEFYHNKHLWKKSNNFYTRHYNLQLVYLLSHFWGPFLVFKEVFTENSALVYGNYLVVINFFLNKKLSLNTQKRTISILKFWAQFVFTSRLYSFPFHSIPLYFDFIFSGFLELTKSKP